jgi:hypothetical protein
MGRQTYFFEVIALDQTLAAAPKVVTAVHHCVFMRLREGNVQNWPWTNLSEMRPKVVAIRRNGRGKARRVPEKHKASTQYVPLALEAGRTSSYSMLL